LKLRKLRQCGSEHGGPSGGTTKSGRGRVVNVGVVRPERMLHTVFSDRNVFRSRCSAPMVVPWYGNLKKCICMYCSTLVPGTVYFDDLPYIAGTQALSTGGMYQEFS